MIEILRSPKPFSHILIMDDDIEIAPTAIILSINLLSYLKDEYKRHFIGGAMINLDRRNILYASLEWVDKKHFGNRGRHSDINNRAMALDTSIYSFHPNQFQSWWYCIIPLEIANLNNLPLPLFFQYDDIEYVMRNKAKIILMNGVSVWHEPFRKKNSNMKLYFSSRNFLIFSTIEKLFSIQQRWLCDIKNDFRCRICQFNYLRAQVYIDALEDFLKGPDILKSAKTCTEILKREMFRNEKMLSFRELGINKSMLSEKIWQSDGLHGIRKRLYNLTKNGHYLPSFMRNKDPIIIHHSNEQGPLCYMRDTLIVVDPENEVGIVRKFNKQEGLRLIRTFKKVYSQCLKEKESLLEKYRSAHKYLTSIEFYSDYLNLKN